MIAAVREWLASLVAVSMLLSVVQILLPEGSLRKIGMFVGGLVLLTALLRPVLAIETEKLAWDWEAYQREIQQRQEQLAEEQEAELTELIETQTAAYISDKAASLGLTVSARVKAEKGADGVPMPVGAELTGEASDLLSDWIAAELGIPKERQVWYEGKS